MISFKFTVPDVDTTRHRTWSKFGGVEPVEEVSEWLLRYDFFVAEVSLIIDGVTIFRTVEPLLDIVHSAIGVAGRMRRGKDITITFTEHPLEIRFTVDVEKVHVAPSYGVDWGRGTEYRRRVAVEMLDFAQSALDRIHESFPNAGRNPYIDSLKLFLTRERRESSGSE
ncbi:hypothetical protein LX16_1797 [Stackebrandtia albiflava]|uniref:Uncharacterized protein n=1 Tax=Stackebrandtia albiflava TaxID=406432 RepID=A0A562VDY8_9ACTN|nr:hypothetical protein [Stackebrandtia albiflava]TWJ16075.1 hypothetical protein LX16_1797 [Stackebrandtia albiflava]